MSKKLLPNEMILGKLKMMVPAYKGNFEWKWSEWDMSNIKQSITNWSTKKHAYSKQAYNELKYHT